MIYTIVNYYVIHYDVLFKQWYINIQKKYNEKNDNEKKYNEKYNKKLKVINTLLKRRNMTDILKLSLYHLLSSIFKQFSLILKMSSLENSHWIGFTNNNICANYDLLFFLSTQHMFPIDLVKKLRDSSALDTLDCNILSRCNEPSSCYFKCNIHKKNDNKKPYIDSLTTAKHSLNTKDKIMILIHILLNRKK